MLRRYSGKAQRNSADQRTCPILGAKMGAAIRLRLRSDAVILTGSIAMTCGNVLEQRSCQPERLVRIEVLVGSGLRGPRERGRRARNAQCSSDGWRERLPGTSRPVGPAVGCSHRGSREHQRRGGIQDATLGR